MDPKQVSAQEKREHADPHEQAMSIPIPILILVALMVIFGIFYILAGDSSTPPEYGDQRTMKDLMAKAASTSDSVDGAAIYTARCVACHQATGAGLPGVFPPLAGSDWVAGKPEVIAKIVLHGVQGTLTVNGTAFNGAMPPFKEQMNDVEIAAVATYVRKSWGNAAPPVGAAVVAAARTETASRTEPWKGDAELAAMK
ncbi:cytochrome C oxidase Cbb3 [Betaproteobacteria bacterium GR16-43]|nr:cytochrome C oxidase Cbb3 [Betaproteobacteria bacterium GR16-43]